MLYKPTKIQNTEDDEGTMSEKPTPHGIKKSQLQKNIPQAPSIESIRAENDEIWQRIRRVHSRVEAEDGSDDTNNIDQYALQIALESEIELQKNVPIPSAREAVSEGIRMHASLVSQEISNDLKDLAYTEAVLDRRIKSLLNDLHEREQFFKETTLLYEKVKDQHGNQNEVKVCNENKEEVLMKKAKEDNQWLREALIKFSDVIKNDQKKATLEDHASSKLSSFPYLSQASELECKKRPANNRICKDQAKRCKTDVNETTPALNLNEMIDKLVRRKIQNPDDPYVILSKVDSESYVVDLLLRSGVVERHEDNNCLLRLYDLSAWN